MHATSPEREETARLLARIVEESGADGAAFGWTDALAPEWIVPVHAVATEPVPRWELEALRTFAVLVEETPDASWYLVLRGVDESRLEGVSGLLARATQRLRDPSCHESVRVPERATEGPPGRLVGLMDAYRMVGFETGKGSHAGFLQNELRRSVEPLRGALAGPARAVTEAFGDLDRLSATLLGLGRVLEGEGELASAAAIYVIAYEVALRRTDVQIGIDAARFAGRAHRKLTDWEPAVRWYGVGRRLAELENDQVQLARALDGLGNTYRDRGAYPKARECYRSAWEVAQSAGDPVEIGNVAHGLMNAERKAGRLRVAAQFGWRAIRTQSDPRERAHLLLNVGTLLLEGGDVDAAERAYRAARAADGDRELHLMAQDALAYCAALRGDRGAYERLRPRGLKVAPYLRVQLGYFRGAALQTLGDERAARVLRAVSRYARLHGLAEWEIKASQRLERALPPSVRAVETPDEVRQGLQELCASLS